MNVAWSCTEDMNQMGLNAAVQALPSGSTHVCQAGEEAKDTQGPS